MEMYVDLTLIPDIAAMAGVGIAFGSLMPFAMRLIAYVIDAVRVVTR